jgi:hypothetical protein
MAKTTKASIIEDVLLEEILGNKELEADKSEDKTEKSDEAQNDEEEKQPVTEADAKALHDTSAAVAQAKGEDLDSELADEKQDKAAKDALKSKQAAIADKAPGEVEPSKKATEVIVAESADADADDVEKKDDEAEVTETADSEEEEVVVAHEGEDEEEKKKKDELGEQEIGEEGDEDLEKCDFSDDIAALDAADGSLSEAYKVKAATIFEAAVTSKLREKSKALRESYQRQLDKKSAEVSEQMLDQIDRYLTHVAESYVEKNAAVIDANLRGEIAESFIKNLHSVFTEHYVEVPVAKRDLTAELELKVKSLEEAVATQTSRNKILAESVVAYKRDEIIENLTKDLAATQVSKVKSLLEGVSYKDATSFTAKVATIVESYASRPAKKDINQNPLETITESTQSSGNSIIDATMKVLSNLK